MRLERQLRAELDGLENFKQELTDRLRYVDKGTQTINYLGASYSDRQREVDRKFFQQIPGKGERHEDVAIVAVNHVFPGIDVCFDELKTRADFAILIPKGSSDNAATKEEFGDRYNFQLDKKSCKNVDQVVACFDKYIGKDKKIILMDHGGYFAENLAELQKALNGRILGVIENTQNGHDKYVKQKDLPVPVISLAACELKNKAEASIGSSVVEATKAIMRRKGMTMFDITSTLVLGYGKVGAAIADCLPSQTITVYDVSESACRKASDKGFIVAKGEDKEKGKEARLQALSKAQVIFCAGGRNALKAEDYPHLKDGCIIATVTSRDEALHLPPASYKRVNDDYRHSHIYTYRDETTGHVIHLLNDGDAVNFIEQSPVNGHSIKAVEGLEVGSFEHIYANHAQLPRGLQDPPLDLQGSVETIWENIYQRKL
ncbi:adenosylhomocysteinase [Ktedonobacteria bacterium brp13]|nr:adenosylhomocysteinase [Ktedonobacteria bacterium brp13]